jgi:hypothetical protein
MLHLLLEASGYGHAFDSPAFTLIFAVLQLDHP